MKIRIFNSIFFIALIITTNTSIGAAVKSIEISSGSGSRDAIIVRLKGIFTTPVAPKCGKMDKLKLRNDAFYFDEIYSLLLSAQLSEKDIFVEISGTAPNDCYIDTVKIDNP